MSLITATAKLKDGVGLGRPAATLLKHVADVQQKSQDHVYVP